ncbi:hypothetical protein NFI96_026280 [Prochilodus magdalenae]|nr:hypothetical protein NFI96_026280 [Prochilodus magdalenae]
MLKLTYNNIQKRIIRLKVAYAVLTQRALLSSKREATSQIQECLAEIGHGGESSEGWETVVLLDCRKEEKLVKLWSEQEWPFDISSNLLPRQSGKGEKVDRICSSPRNSRV